MARLGPQTRFREKSVAQGTAVWFQPSGTPNGGGCFGYLGNLDRSDGRLVPGAVAGIEMRSEP